MQNLEGDNNFETKGFMIKEEVIKNRSYGGCITAAYKMMKDNMKMLLKKTWILVLVISVISTALSLLYLPDKQIHDFGMANVKTTTLLMMLSPIVLFVICLVLFGTVCSFLNKQKIMWNIVRALKMGGAIVIFTIILASIIGGVILFCGPYLFNKATTSSAQYIFIFSIGSAILCMALFLPLSYVQMKYQMTGKENKLFAFFLKGYKTGFKYWGYIFVTILLSLIVTIVVMFFTSLPYAIMYICQIQNQMGMLNGDPNGVPTYFHILFFISGMFLYFIYWYLQIWQYFVCYHMMGSIEAKEREKQVAKSYTK